jgi:ABC-type nitrate/sulfonate/bicarbonate transport system permease component
MKKFFKPLEGINKTGTTTIMFSWLILLIIFWVGCSFGETHLFPTPTQVLNGFKDLWSGGLVVHIMSSIALCAQAVVISIIISLVFAYSSAIPFFKPVGTFMTKLRFLPLTGIAFYVGVLIHDARGIQIAVLIVFMTTFLTTSLMNMIKDIPEEEFFHARTLGCNRWETLWEVVIKGRFDYVFELVRQNLAIVWMMLVTVESILVAAGGLGTLIKNGDRLGDNGRVIAVQIIIVLLGLSLDFLITKIRKGLFRYSNY